VELIKVNLPGTLAYRNAATSITRTTTPVTET
jgi:hypothetical protein